jgi:hypothetical protein
MGGASRSTRNPRKFLEIIEAKSDDRTKRFSNESLDQLKEYLADHGYINERPILSDNEIRHEFLPLTVEEQDRHFIETLLESI